MSDLKSTLDLGRRRLAILSIRGTGFDPNTDRIIEVGAVIHARGKPAKAYHKLVAPAVPILPDATRSHGLTDADLGPAPFFENIADGFARFLGACDLAGFGLRRFQLPLLMAEFRRCGVGFTHSGRSIVDLRELYLHFEPHDLEAALSSYLGLPPMPRANALAIAEASTELLEAQLRRHPELPRTTAGLAAFPRPRDPEGWFHVSEGRHVFATGRYRGRTADEVAALNPHYLRSILSPSMEWMARVTVQRALERLIPLADPFEGVIIPSRKARGAGGPVDPSMGEA